MSDAAPATGDSTAAATASETTPATGTPATETAAEPTLEELQQELAKATANAHKWEKLAKTNTSALKELEAQRREQMTDHERALTDARAEGLSEATRRFGGRLVDAEVRAAAAGRIPTLDAALEALDRTIFLTEDGEVDSTAIAKWVERLVPETSTNGAPAPVDLGQGVRGRPESVSLGDDPLLKAIVNKVGPRRG